MTLMQADKTLVKNCTTVAAAVRLKASRRHSMRYILSEYQAACEMSEIGNSAREKYWTHVAIRLQAELRNLLFELDGGETIDFGGTS